MVTLPEICLFLDELLAPATFQDYCPNGIQVEGRREIRSLATAVTASLKVIQKAVEEKVDLLLVHHGLFWQRESEVIQGVKREKLALLLTHHINLLAYHLPLDAHALVGNNWRAARDLGWQELQKFEAPRGSFIGVSGRFPPLSRTLFQQQLENYYGQPAQVVFGGQEQVTSAALISGGAYRYLPYAASAGIDCFITGNVDEPVWHLAHEEKINFFGLGHAATERVGPKALGQLLSEKFSLPYRFIDEPNPF